MGLWARRKCKWPNTHTHTHIYLFVLGIRRILCTILQVSYEYYMYNIMCVPGIRLLRVYVREPVKGLPFAHANNYVNIDFKPLARRKSE